MVRKVIALQSKISAGRNAANLGLQTKQGSDYVMIGGVAGEDSSIEDPIVIYSFDEDDYEV